MPALLAVSGIESHLGFWLRFVSNHVSGRFAQLLADKGVSVTEWMALRTMYKEDVSTHQELINTLGMTKGAASKLLTRLEKRGLVQRVAQIGRGREQGLILSAAGLLLVPELAALADANDALFFAGLSTEERQVLLSCLQKVVATHGLQIFPQE